MSAGEHVEPIAGRDGAETERIPDGAVVAAVKGGEKDRAVVEFGAKAAMRSGAPLHLLSAREVWVEMTYALPPTGMLIGAPNGIDDSRAAEQYLDQARALAVRLSPDLPISQSSPIATATQALCDASRHATLVVVGADQRSALARAALGTTTLGVAMHARCPVAVVPPSYDAATALDRVVVAVDGSDCSTAAAAYGFAAAEAYGLPLTVLTTWHREFLEGAVVTVPGSPHWEQTEAKYTRLVERTIEGLPQKHPTVDYTIEVRNGSTVKVIAESAGPSGLLLMGSRGRGGFRGMLLGSVSHGVLQRATGPVIVVRSQ